MRHILFAACLVLLSRTSQAQKKIIYTSDEKNISSNSAFLSDGELNNNPKAIIIVEADANARAANPHPVGVWYTGSQWAIFNQDMAAMPAGVTFIITWNNPGVNAFYQKLAKENLSNGKMIIDNPSLNNNPSASFFVSQVWNPEGFGGIYNNSDINVEYDKQFGKWMVRNMNGMGLPDGSAYNIIITGTGNAKNNPNYNYPITNPEKNNPEEIDKNAKNKDIADKTSNPIVNEKDLKNIDIINKNTKPTTNPVTTSPVTNIPVDVLANADILAKAAFGTNFGFENQLFNWTATGTAFNNQPVEGNTVMSERVLTQMRYDNNGIGGDYWKGMAYPIGFRDRYWIGTYENGNGDAPTGTLTSLPFKTEKKYLAYLMGGGKDINRLYVELQVKQSDYEAVWGAGQRSFYGETADGFARVDRQTPLINSEELFRYWFDLDAELNRQYVNKTIRICIVDNSSNGWGHINADDFVQTDYVNSFLELNRGGFTLYADPDVPVWGFFDSHAHPAADEAFGKKYYVGSSNTPLSTTWSNDICTANHTAGRTLDGFTNIFDPHKFFDGGWPDMIGYPRFNGKMHQKYQADLIKRAWQGGLRIFCAVGVNNMYIATRALGHGDNG
ncbi:MAG TPA: hypothetical protein VIV35_09075, partial [Chitinophagaceae bacterium]